MAKTIMLVPTCSNAVISNVSLALLDLLAKEGKKVAFMQVVNVEISTALVNEKLPVVNTLPAASHDKIRSVLANGEMDLFLEDLIARQQNLVENNDILVVEGVALSNNTSYAHQLNKQVAQALGAQIIMVSNTNDYQKVKYNVEVKAYAYGGKKSELIAGVITNPPSIGEEQLTVVKEEFASSPLNLLMTVVKDEIKFKNDAFFKDLCQPSTGIAKLSPPAFRHKLTQLAIAANKCIVLPEGDEPRTVKAASICAEKGIARCILLADPASVAKVAAEQGVELGVGVEIVDPAAVRENYVARLVELRKSKGLTVEQAREQLADNVVLGTMMLEANEVDGLVSGAVHTTANTIRPPFQIIKTNPGCSIVSSIFFMLLPDQVLVYGDCAVNPNPTAEQIAEIAIQSADSAKAFGLDAKVAMISYSTGSSGMGPDVEKVTLATKLAQEKRPDLLIDGPLQYDAAIMPEVAKSKAPNSKVAGQATVFIFPDLNTGNTTYKAVQRSSDLVSIGPMLQGMRKPVNDLSRGALVDDIVYTIALTAIQATM